MTKSKGKELLLIDKMKKNHWPPLCIDILVQLYKQYHLQKTCRFDSKGHNGHSNS